MNNAKDVPRGKAARFDKRIWFVGKACEIDQFRVSVQIANDWYINNKGKDMDNEEALRRFKEWLGEISSPDN